MLRPLLASAALRQLSPRKITTPNYYPKINQLRDESPHRQRSGSVKRNSDGQILYSTILTGTNNKAPPPPTPGIDRTKTNEELEIEISKVSSIVDKVDTTLAGLEIDRNILMVFYDIKEALRGIVKSQEIILKERKEQQVVTDTSIKAITPSTQLVTQMVDLGSIAKKPRQMQQKQDNCSERHSLELPAPRDTREESSEITKFKEAVKKAENSTLVFNLDMGRVPIMNTETIKTKATLALTTMAAKLETGNHTSIPCEDTIASIDDVLSLVTNMELYGRKTKTYTNARDKNSGLFCTLPVKYEFPDRDTRIEAEKILQDKCGANLSTPYPTILRECIKQVIDKVKTDYPSNQVRVTVDPNNFCLKVSMRHKVEGSVGRWEFFEKRIPLPNEALDVDSRKVPAGFKMEFLPPNAQKGTKGSPEKTISNDVASMEEDRGPQEQVG
jgi:hypothetical protein